MFLLPDWGIGTIGNSRPELMLCAAVAFAVIALVAGTWSKFYPDFRHARLLKRMLLPFALLSGGTSLLGIYFFVLLVVSWPLAVIVLAAKTVRKGRQK